MVAQAAADVLSSAKHATDDDSARISSAAAMEGSGLSFQGGKQQHVAASKQYDIQGTVVEAGTVTIKVMIS